MILDSVQHMGTKRISSHYIRMIEVGAGVRTHAQLFHDAYGFPVDCGGEADDLDNATTREDFIKYGGGAFGRDALAPMRRCQSPADLDAGHEGRFETRYRDADKA